MSQLVVLSLGTGDLHSGFPVVTAHLWECPELPPVKFIGSLPAAPQISVTYRSWQLLYHALCHRLDLSARIEVEASDITNVSAVEFSELCEQLVDQINVWLNSEPFRNIDQQLRTNLNASDEIRVLIETNDPLLRRLPWHVWSFFEHYPKAEIALSASEYQRSQSSSLRNNQDKVRILAILGNSQGINLNQDRAFLEQLSDQAEIEFLVEPQRKQLNERLWQGWDVLFFAGHSSSQEKGLIQINPTDSLTLDQLKYALKQAIAQGLKLAVFNSCDGLGLVQQLADLHIPQMIAMREPVPDLVAQEFLKHFLKAFVQGETLYLAVRQAREQLQGLEDHFPCATWLPVIYQNPAEQPLRWKNLSHQNHKVTQDKLTHFQRQAPWLLVGSGVAIVLALMSEINGFSSLFPTVSSIEQQAARSPKLPELSIAHTFPGHKEAVWSVAISPGGQTFASGSEDSTIKLWHLKTGELIRTLAGDSGAVRSVAISPDGQTLVSGQSDNTVHIWNIKTGKLKQTLRGHLAPVWAVAISSDGQTLATGSYDGTIKLWNLNTGELNQTLAGHSGPVWSISMSPDGNSFASASSDKTVKIWNLQTGELLRPPLIGHSDAVRTVVIGSDNQTLVSGSWDRTIKIWNLHTGELGRTLSGHENRITALALSPNNQTIASGSVDQTIMLWNLGTGESLTTLSPHSDWILSLAISPDGQALLSGSRDRNIFRFDGLQSQNWSAFLTRHNRF
ncbi:CHAT domain-containing protein [Leptolyngbya sp. FACHB-541]|uniref:CHAT domain-containing protein n=1 Tax=Leptolyngbya sp. FACHB-541 TaxID=2692810 RepID=UPI0016874056|nr:CHAT domain-containing protein [Leptolyngbya sp. FACHB-541]MBD2000121.1 CHAT domain-containing protein [Leptolyngbya sp. FACHB-541]